MKLVILGALVAPLLSLATPFGMSAADAPVAPPVKQTLAKDGYYIESHTHNVTDFRVTIHKYSSYEEIAKAWKKRGGKPPSPGKRTMAFAHWNKEGTHCEVHIVNPAIEYRPEYIGHELVHCMFGSFHPTQG